MNAGLKDLLGWACFAHVWRNKWNTTQASGVLLKDFHQSNHEAYLELFLFSYHTHHRIY